MKSNGSSYFQEDSTKYKKSFNKRNREAIVGTFLTPRGFGFIVSFAGHEVLIEFRYGFSQATASFFIDGLQPLKEGNKTCKTKQKQVNKETKKQTKITKTPPPCTLHYYYISRNKPKLLFCILISSDNFLAQEWQSK